jgi:hypothetical protein
MVPKSAPLCLVHREPPQLVVEVAALPSISAARTIMPADMSLSRDRLLVGLAVESTDPATMCEATARLAYEVVRSSS